MATLNGFSVSVPQAQKETSDGYVVMRHGDTFKLRLSNKHKFAGSCKPADAEIYVQGKYCGTFRVPYGQSVTLERPLNDTGKFTAYRNGTPEAAMADIDPDDDDNGLIKVVWKPGYTYEFPAYYPSERDWPQYFDMYNNHHDDGGYMITYSDNTSCNYTDNTTRSYSTIQCSANTGHLVGGGVGLSGESRQSFQETNSLVYDESESVIYLRIAFVTENEPRPIENTIRAVVYKVETNKPKPL